MARYTERGREREREGERGREREREREREGERDIYLNSEILQCIALLYKKAEYIFNIS
jgi:hypothetical protein